MLSAILSNVLSRLPSIDNISPFCFGILHALAMNSTFTPSGFSTLGKINQIGALVYLSSVDILDCSVRVTVEGPPVSDFDPHPTLKSWWNSGPRARRPNFND